MGVLKERNINDTRNDKFLLSASLSVIFTFIRRGCKQTWRAKLTEMIVGYIAEYYTNGSKEIFRLLSNDI